MRIVSAAGTVVFALLLAPPAGAHKVNVFAYAEGGTVYAEGYFVDGTPTRESRISAYATDGSVVAQGSTDDDGRFSFQVEKAQDLRIVLEASMGHRNEITLTAAEMGGPEGSRAAVPERVAAPSTGAAPEALESTLDRVLARRLQPLQESLARLRQAQESPGVSQILGGLGYIVGLAGAYLWGVSRRRGEAA
jgi:nickel transport protein